MKDPVQQLYDWLNERGLNEARNHSAPPRRFRASEASNCTRSIWFRLKGSRPAPRNARGQLFGIGGDAHHDVTRQLFEHTGSPIGGVTYNEDGSVDEHMLVRREYTVRTPDGRDITFDVTSRADGKITTPRGEALCEIKSTGHWPYEWLSSAYTEGFKPVGGDKIPPGHDAALARVKEKHKSWYWQCQVTMALCGYKLCYLIVKDRSGEAIGLHNTETGESGGIYIPFDQVVFDEILQRFAYASRKLADGEKPVAEFAAKSQTCSYCDFRYLCHGAAERRAKGLEPAVLHPGPQFEEHDDGEAVEDSGPVRKNAKRKDVAS